MNVFWLLGFLVTTTPATQPAEVWVGHQVVEGSRSVPVLGELATRTDSFVIAHVEHREDGIHLRQRACRVDIKEQMGVKVSLNPRAVANLPVAHIRMTKERDGTYRMQPWEVRWDEEDIDRDGKPGATVEVDSTLCGGDIYVGSSTVSAAEGRATDDGIAGYISVEIEQKVHGASGMCLSMAASDTRETQMGRFVYRRVPASTTCADLRKSWPVRVGDRVATRGDGS